MQYTKQTQLRSNRKKSKNKNFSPRVKREIFERDNHSCVKCGSHLIESVPHHIVYKSDGGTGDKRNGATVCISCHGWAHHKNDSKFGEPSSEGRKWFEDWAEQNLDERGDLK